VGVPFKCKGKWDNDKGGKNMAIHTQDEKGGLYVWGTGTGLCLYIYIFFYFWEETDRVPSKSWPYPRLKAIISSL